MEHLIQEIEGEQSTFEVNGGDRAYTRGEIWGGRLLGVIACVLLFHYFYINWGTLVCPVVTH